MCLVGHQSDYLLAFNQRQRRVVLRVSRVVWPHVVRVGEAEILVKPMALGEELPRVAEVPLAENRGRVSASLEHLRDGLFLVADAHFGFGAKRPEQANPIRITPGQ